MRPGCCFFKGKRKDLVIVPGAEKVPAHSKFREYRIVQEYVFIF